ncbi:MAG: AmmeMemoRadiSam system protein A [Spirochaetaceae bacterium]|jgi:AmmeMemoRadiSam system protein A|nr:AmmeMemoRadiSam system protein A [Spirochaetaceae bacterium]
MTLCAEEKQKLLAAAREAIAARLGCPSASQNAFPSGKPEGALALPLGVFVTLRGARGELRGCIGRLEGAAALWDAARDLALAAAFEDPRFPPLSAAELDRCAIEISVLSPMKRRVDFDAIQIGVDGLYLRHRARSGVFLPQVPVEQGWTLQEYLEQLCVKASLPARSYLADDAELYSFTALVFGEQSAAD